MKTKIFITAISLLLFTGIALADKPIQLALVPDVQLVPQSEGITGLRLNIYGKNTSLKGVDLGIVNVLTKPSVGLQYGLVGINESDFSGWTDNFVNINKGTFVGVSSGALNKAKNAAGIQWGFINCAAKMHGIQLGVLNKAQSLEGVQIGFINVIKNNGFMPIFPIVNWSF